MRLLLPASAPANPSPLQRLWCWFFQDRRSWTTHGQGFKSSGYLCLSMLTALLDSNVHSLFAFCEWKPRKTAGAVITAAASDRRTFAFFGLNRLVSPFLGFDAARGCRLATPGSKTTQWNVRSLHDVYMWKARGQVQSKFQIFESLNAVSSCSRSSYGWLLYRGSHLATPRSKKAGRLPSFLQNCRLVSQQQQKRTNKEG